MVAAETPETMIDRALGTLASGTSRITTAVESDQKPPSAAPSSSRPASSTSTLPANATIRLETISSSEKPISTCRRSIRWVKAATSRLATTPIAAVAVTACPARPSLMRRSPAIGVSRLAGRNSAPTRLKTPRLMAKTAAQAPAVEAGGEAAGEAAAGVLSVMGLSTFDKC